MMSQLHINWPINACAGICCIDANWELTGIDVLCLSSELLWPYEEFMSKCQIECADADAAKILRKIKQL